MKTLHTYNWSGVLIVLLSCLATGQEPREPLSAVPPSFRKSLNERIGLFSDYQAAQNWSGVADLLGNYRSVSKRIRYSAPEKLWLIEQIKNTRLLKFTPRSSSWSTAVLALPMSQRSWYIEGLAEFSDGPLKVQPASLVAYRDNGNWYFYPFVRNECGEVTAPQMPDFSLSDAERKLPALSLAISQRAPVEVLDFSITKIGDSDCSPRRKMVFKLRNIGIKVINGFGFLITDLRSNEGSTSVGVGLSEDLKPGQATPYEDDVWVGQNPRIVQVDFVRFSDGTFWRAKKTRK